MPPFTAAVAQPGHVFARNVRRGLACITLLLLVVNAAAADLPAVPGPQRLMASPETAIDAADGSDAAPAGDPEPTDQARPPVPASMDRIQVTATRRPQADTDTGKAVTVVSAEQAAEQAPLTIADALRGQPGSHVQATTPGQAGPIVRGLKGSEVLHLVDGFRLNHALFRNAPNQYFALVDAQNLERVELLRGPAAALYGSDAMGGVVHVLTPEPSFAGDGWYSSARTRARFGSADSSWLGRVSAATGGRNFAIRAGMTRQEVGERRAGDGQRLPFTAFGMRASDARLRWAPAPGHELGLSVQYLEQPQTQRFDELTAGFGQLQPGSEEFFFEPQTRSFAQLRYRLTPAAAWFDALEFQAGQQLTRDDRRTRDFGSRLRDLERNRDRLRGASLVVSKSLAAHELVWGVETYRDEVDSSRRRVDLDNGATTERAPRFPDGARMHSHALYLADQWRLGERWLLDIGGRYSGFDIDIPDGAEQPGVRLRPHDVSGNAGVVYRIDPQLSLVANLGRGFRAPNIFDLGVFGDRPGNRFAIPNPQLEPESVLSADLGLKLQRRGTAAEVFVWRSEYRDKITSVDTGQVLDNGRIVVQNRNIAELSLWGVEAGLRQHLGEASELHVVLNHTRGEERATGSSTPADRIPPLNGRLGVRHFLRDDLSVDAYADFAARQQRLSPRDRSDPRIDPLGTSGWVSWNVRLDWDLAAGRRVSLAVLNVADRRYREHGSGVDAPGRGLGITFDWSF